MPKKIIYAEDAIDALAKGFWGVDWDKALAEAIIKDLPSAQPEIIRCKDCMLMLEDKIFHRCWCNGNEVKPDHFCGYAERRQDEQEVDIRRGCNRVFHG